MPDNLSMAPAKISVTNQGWRSMDDDAAERGTVWAYITIEADSNWAAAWSKQKS